MPIPDVIRKCVGFIYVRTAADVQRPIGTGFLVGRGGKERECFFVTAKHVIDGARKLSTDPDLYIRFNTRAGKADFVSVPLADWVVHPTDPLVDIAVLKGAPHNEIFDVQVVDESMILTAEQVRNEEVALGDEVCTVGLFVNHIGRERNVPIVRVGAL